MIEPTEDEIVFLKRVLEFGDHYTTQSSKELIIAEELVRKGYLRRIGSGEFYFLSVFGKRYAIAKSKGDLLR